MTATNLGIILCITSTICMWSAFLLAYNWQEVRQRRWLSLVLVLWGLAWGTRAYGLLTGDVTSIYETVLPPELITVGIIASVTFLVWPLTIVRPEGIKSHSIVMFWLPFILCILFYWVIIGTFELQQFTFTSLGELLSHMSYFSVWYRFVMCACLLGYMIYTLYLISHYIRDYNRYVEENCSEYERYTISWEYIYLGGLVVVSVFFFANLLYPSYQTFLCHNIVACIFLAWLSAKVMVYNSPFFGIQKEKAAPQRELPQGEDFNSQFHLYKNQIQEWMETEHPYLNTDFNLQEIMNRFKLNRTYAYKIFNDGFGKSFLMVVRDYRIEYARKAIEKDPSIAMTEVAHLCGYSTAQAFHKAFAYCNDGLTPGKYALSCAKGKQPRS